MQLVYENLMGGSGEDTLGALIAFTPEGDDQAYIDATVAGIESHAEELDALIGALQHLSRAGTYRARGFVHPARGAV